MRDTHLERKLKIKKVMAQIEDLFGRLVMWSVSDKEVGLSRSY
jgi:hypothetical protein